MYVQYIYCILVCIRAYLYSSTVIEGLALVNIHNRSYLLFLYKYLQNIDFTPAIKGNFHNQILRYTERRHQGKSDTGEVVLNTLPSRARTISPIVIARFEVQLKVPAASQEDGGGELREDRCRNLGGTKERWCKVCGNNALSWKHRDGGDVKHDEGSGVSFTSKILFREKRASTSAAHCGATKAPRTRPVSFKDKFQSANIVLVSLSGTKMFVPNKTAKSAVCMNSLKS